jgi:exosortase
LDELRISPVGLLMLGGVFGLRYAAGKYYLESLDGWTIPLWIAGAVWMLAGWQCVRWALSSVLFLYFMIPLPYSIGRMFSLPLQTVATRISTFCLQILGQPAIAEGHTIWIDKRQLFVEEACSGLRILLGIAALAVGLVMLTQWNPWQKLAVVIFAIPVAIAANAIRIVIIGLLHAWELEKSIVQQGHDLTGIMMIPLAAIMLLLIGQFAGKLFRESQVVSPFAMGRD